MTAIASEETEKKGIVAKLRSSDWHAVGRNTVFGSALIGSMGTLYDLAKQDAGWNPVFALTVPVTIDVYWVSAFTVVLDGTRSKSQRAWATVHFVTAISLSVLLNVVYHGLQTGTIKMSPSLHYALVTGLACLPVVAGGALVHLKTLTGEPASKTVPVPEPVRVPEVASRVPVPEPVAAPVPEPDPAGSGTTAAGSGTGPVPESRPEPAVAGSGTMPAAAAAPQGAAEPAGAPPASAGQKKSGGRAGRPAADPWERIEKVQAAFDDFRERERREPKLAEVQIAVGGGNKQLIGQALRVVKVRAARNSLLEVRRGQEPSASEVAVAAGVDEGQASEALDMIRDREEAVLEATG